MENANKLILEQYTRIPLPLTNLNNIKIYSVKLQVQYWIKQQDLLYEVEIDNLAQVGLYLLDVNKKIKIEEKIGEKLVDYINKLDYEIFPLYETQNNWEQTMIEYISNITNTKIMNKNTLYMKIKDYDYVYNKIYDEKLEEIQKKYEKIKEEEIRILPSFNFAKNWEYEIIGLIETEEGNKILGKPKGKKWKCFPKQRENIELIMANKPIKIKYFNNDKYNITKKLNIYGIYHYYYDKWIFVLLTNYKDMERTYKAMISNLEIKEEGKRKRFANIDTYLYYSKKEGRKGEEIIRDFTEERSYLIIF